MSKAPTRPGFAQQADAFLSYARSDIDTARTLVQSLADAGLEVALDVTHLMPGEDYAQRLDALLLASAKVVFLATPDSLASDACRHELDLARRYAKPILPVLAPALAKADLPEALREVQYLRLAAPDLIPRLAAAIRVDLDWERRHADYERLAARGPAEVITHRRALHEAQDWLVARPQNASPVSDAVRALIERSQKRLRRWRQALISALSIVALVMAGLSAGLFQQWQDAREQTRLAAEQRAIAETQRQVAEDQATRARQSLGLLYAREADRLDPDLQTDAGLLLLLQAGEMVAPEDVPRVASVFGRFMDVAEAQVRFTIPGDSVAFEHENVLYYQVPSEGGLWRIDPFDGPVRIADWPGELLHIVPATPIDGLPMLAMTESDTDLTLAYVDPATGRRGPQVQAALPQRPWPMEASVDIGPDGVALVELYLDVYHRDYTGEFEDSADTPILIFDIQRGFAAEIDPEAVFGPEGSNALVRLSVGAEGQSLIWLRSSDAAGRPAARVVEFGPDGALRLAAAPVPRPDPRVDCLERGLYSGDVDALAAQLEALIAAGTISMASEPGYATPANGHCLVFDGHFVFVGTQGTSAGAISTLFMVSPARLADPRQSEIHEMELFHPHFRPSGLLIRSEDPPTLLISALDRDEVVVLKIRDGRIQESSLDFPFYVGHGVLSPQGHFIALEGRGRVRNSAPAFLRVTVMSPYAVTYDSALVADAIAPNRPIVNIGSEGLELQDSHGERLVVLPPFLSRFDSMTIPVPFDRDAPVIIAAPDGRTVERISRDADGAWQRQVLFVTSLDITDLWLAPDGDLLTVWQDTGIRDIEAHVYSLAGRTEVLRVPDHRWQTDLVRIGESPSDIATVVASIREALAEWRSRAQAALSARCQPQAPGDWASSPCWPTDL